MKEMVKNLYDQAKAFNAGEVHYKVDKIFHEAGASAVLSVYINENPSNEILSGLVEWAEENDNQELLNKIKELATI